ncbi:O-antigen export system permease protein RfbD [Castellaniella defragrans 65Phen]|uniref:Transport permease protein n=1 Tax=Castellaniella defragrans (strain DSM 12143 / CCUG 39792 / 65Phen) TaxID=1437824 RepID=W8X0P2_CASD6|nr:ABC transporter permease [Castellaniella defragrans]CDM22491.1 O-antigen export system permease protein RfbD [Castellaniella defragrans 65Phen]
MTWRDILGRYRGSAGGLAWSLLTPILMLAVYTIVFSGIFKARWSDDAASPLDYALQLFVGLIVHGLAAECINRAPGLVVGNVSYVKRVLFPLDTLPVINLLSALFHSAISIMVLLVFFAFVEHHLPVTALWLPVVVFPYLLMLAGVSWLLAALGVYLRDIAQLMGLVTMILMFLSPVFYPVAKLPERFHVFFHLNPLTLIIEQARVVTLSGGMPNLPALGLYTLVALAVAWAGLSAFHKMKKGFADVL